MKNFSDIWSQLANEGGPLPFLLIDCAGIEGGEARIPKEIFSKIECLFTGDLGIELADVGPWLGQLHSLEEDVKAHVIALLKNSVALIALQSKAEVGRSNAMFSDIHRHFRKFNTVYDPMGNPVFFRYYDPRVFLDVLSTFSSQQLHDFYGPMAAFLATASDGVTLRCDINGGNFTVTT